MLTVIDQGSLSKSRTKLCLHLRKSILPTGVTLMHCPRLDIKESLSKIRTKTGLVLSRGYRLVDGRAGPKLFRY